MSEYKGKAGTIYVIKADDGDIDEGGKAYEAWYEDHFILGLGHSEVGALEDSAQNAADIVSLVSEAVAKAKGG